MTRILSGVAALALVPAVATAQADQTISLGYNGPPDREQNAVHLFASNLERFVEEETDIEIELYPNSSLGGEQERMENVLQTPSMNVASFAGLSAIVPEVFVSATPFLFDGFEEARQFFDEGEYWQMIKDTFAERTGSEILAVVEEGGFLAFTSAEEPIRTAADFEGKRFRAMDPSQVALYEAFGASGTPIPWTEVYSALETGVADGQMNPPMYIIMGSLDEVQKYLTLANIQYSDQFLVANGDWLSSLSEDARQAVADAVERANQRNREAVQAKVEERIQTLEESGMEIIRPDEEAMASFREQGQPAYVDWLLTQDIDRRFLEAAYEDAGQPGLLEDGG